MPNIGSWGHFVPHSLVVGHEETRNMKSATAILSTLLCINVAIADGPNDGLSYLLDRSTNIVVADVARYLGNTIDNFFVANYMVEFKVAEALSGRFDEGQLLFVNVYAYNDLIDTPVMPFVVGDRYILFINGKSNAWYTLDTWHGIYPYGRFRSNAIKMGLEARKNVQPAPPGGRGEAPRP